MSSGRTKLYCEYVATKIILLCFKLMGLAPFSIRTSLEWKKSKRDDLLGSVFVKFSPSNFGCAYNFCLIIIYTGILVEAFSAAYYFEYPNKTSMTMAIEFTASVIGNFAMFMTWLIFGFRQRTAAKLVNLLLSTDGVMSCLNNSLLLESSSSFIILLSIGNTTLCVGLLFTERIALSYPILCYFLYIITSCILSFSIAQYTFIVKLIENRFKAVNRALFDRSIALIENIPRGPFHTPGLSDNFASAPKIATLRQVFINLCEISSETSDFFSLPICVTIAYFSFVFIFNAYYVTVPLVVPMTDNSLLVLINSLFWLICHILPIVMLASGVTNVVRESRKGADIVRKLQTNSGGRRKGNNELEVFSMELMHRKVQFSACGFFSLDLTIVHSILSMVCKYLIIMIQFQMGNSKKSSQESNTTTITTLNNSSD